MLKHPSLRPKQVPADKKMTMQHQAGDDVTTRNAFGLLIHEDSCGQRRAERNRKRNLRRRVRQKAAKARADVNISSHALALPAGP